MTLLDKYNFLGSFTLFKTQITWFGDHFLSACIPCPILWPYEAFYLYYLIQPCTPGLCASLVQQVHSFARLKKKKKNKQEKPSCSLTPIIEFYCNKKTWPGLPGQAGDSDCLRKALCSMASSVVRENTLQSCSISSALQLLFASFSFLAKITLYPSRSMITYIY